MKVGYAILAHDHPENVAALARHLIDGGGLVAIHLDRKAGMPRRKRLSVLWALRHRKSSGLSA